MRASQRSRTETVTVMTASNQSAQQTKMTISTHSEKSLMMTMVRILGEPGCKLKHFKVNWRKSVFCFVFFPLLLDPWLNRKEPKKGKEKKKKKRRKSIDPDSIQSALLASGLCPTRPTFTASVNPPSTPATGKHVPAWQHKLILP